jgi:putative oxidoreductase
MGVRVVGVTRSPAKAVFLKWMGADHVVVGPSAEAAAEIKAYTGGLGVDGAVEFTGNEALAQLCIEAMRPGGTLVTAGADWSGDRFPIRDQDFVRLELTIRGIRGSTLNDQRMVLELLERKSIRPAIFDVLPLSAVARAHDLLERSEVSGRIVLDPWKDP